MKYPEPVHPPDFVFKLREERKNELIKVTWLGIVLRLVIVMIELVGYWFFHSTVLLVDALATGVDIASSIVLVISFNYAAKPPDTNHPFGHGRFEPLVGLQLSLLLIFLGVSLAIQQLKWILSSGPTAEDPISSFAWMIPAVASIILILLSRILLKVAESRASPALKADAEHYRTDAITSIFAMIALLVGSVYPSLSNYFDHLGALLIALIMIILGLRTARGNLSQLMDQAPDSKYFKIVKGAALRVPGVFGTEKIRIQLYGPNAHVDIDVEVDPKQTVEEAHLISQKVRAEVQKSLPEVQDVIVHLEPYYPGDH